MQVHTDKNQGGMSKYVIPTHRPGNMFGATPSAGMVSPMSAIIS